MRFVDPILILLLSATAFSNALEIHDPRKDPQKCGRANVKSPSHLCDSQKVLAAEVQDRIDLIARYDFPCRVRAALSISTFIYREVCSPTADQWNLRDPRS